MTRNVRIGIFCALVALYVATRLWHLTDSCLWFDEIYSVHAAEHSWVELLRFVALDLMHPPLFYVLLKIWIIAGGESLLWLRLLPVCLALVAIAPFHLLGRELGLEKYGTSELLALLFLSVNGSCLKYSQEVRMYSLLMLLGVTSIWLFIRYFNRGRSFWWLVGVNILLVWTHYFGWFVILSEVVAVLAIERSRLRQIAGMCVVVMLSFAPWAIAVFRMATSTDVGQNIGWMARPGVIDVGRFLLNMVEPFYYPLSSVDAASDYRVSVPILLIAILALAAFLVSQGVSASRSIRLLALFWACPIAAAFAMSWLGPYSIWGTRHLIVVFAPTALLLGYLMSNIRQHALRLSAVTLVLLLCGYAGLTWALRATPTYSWCAWEGVARSASEAGADQLYNVEDLAAYHAWFAVRDGIGLRIVRLSGIDGLPQDNAYFLPRGFDGVAKADMPSLSGSPIWLAYRARSLDEREPPLRNFLIKGYRLTDERRVPADGEDVYLIKLEK
ncbi:MAG TPA: hypothetical protein VL501_04490 [Pyrinomonadaceae bacterium]|nr:hypothetical protein [Pyrinomonadaceae bacterium]